MTKNLLITYKSINENSKKRSQIERLNGEQLESLFAPNSYLNKGKYKIIKKIGEGVFGIVLKV